VAGWLYRVAYHVALTARARRTRREARERRVEAGATVPPEPSAPSEQRELAAVVDEEVSRLPERFRTATVLCYLEGKTVEEAARLLGCPRGTVASRLARARARLRGRLARRHLVLRASAVVAALSQSQAFAAAPHALVRQAVRATGNAAAGSAVSTQVVVLTREVLRAMLLRKLMTGAAILTVFAGALLLGSAVTMRLHADPAAEPDRPGAAGGAGQAGKGESRTTSVTVGQPLRRAFTPFADFTGRLEADAVVPVLAPVSGRLLKVHVKAEAEVKRGDLLFEIEPTDQRAALVQAQADLAQADARGKLAAAELQRAAKRFAAGKISRLQFDESAANNAMAEARAKTARTAVELTRKGQAPTRVLAPAAGQARGPDFVLGDAVAGGSLLTGIERPDVMAVRFDLDERSFLHYQRLRRAGQVQGTGSLLSVGLSDEESFPHQGTLDRFDNEFDARTGTIGVHGFFPDPDRLLLPGMFARVRMPFGKPRPVLMVPESAVHSEAGNRFVLIVTDRNVVEHRDVKVGPLEDGLRVMESGLGPDDWVVAGSGKGLRPGDRVEPRRQAPWKD
jgi:RND family efflux transporter MFP subunit